MDANEFSFEALFNSNDFHFDDCLAFKEEYAELNDILEVEIGGSELCGRLENAVESCIYEARAEAFKQGFCFAVKSIKFMLKI